MCTTIWIGGAVLGSCCATDTRARWSLNNSVPLYHSVIHLTCCLRSLTDLIPTTLTAIWIGGCIKNIQSQNWADAERSHRLIRWWSTSYVHWMGWCAHCMCLALLLFLLSPTVTFPIITVWIGKLCRCRILVGFASRLCVSLLHYRQLDGI